MKVCVVGYVGVYVCVCRCGCVGTYVMCWKNEKCEHFSSRSSEKILAVLVLVCLSNPEIHSFKTAKREKRKKKRCGEIGGYV